MQIKPSVLMRLRRCTAVLLGLAVAGLMAIAALSSKAPSPVVVSLVDVEVKADTKRVTVEFLNRNPAAHFAEAHRIQIRVAGRWQPPVSLPKCGDHHLFEQTLRHRLVLDLPRQTDACRWSLGYRVYRVGLRPYCQVHCFLSRHGLYQRFPTLSRVLLKCVSQRPKLRRAECELVVPAGEDLDVRPVR